MCEQIALCRNESDFDYIGIYLTQGTLLHLWKKKQLKTRRFQLDVFAIHYIVVKLGCSGELNAW